MTGLAWSLFLRRLIPGNSRLTSHSSTSATARKRCHHASGNEFVLVKLSREVRLLQEANGQKEPQKEPTAKGPNGGFEVDRIQEQLANPAAASTVVLLGPSFIAHERTDCQES